MTPFRRIFSQEEFEMLIHTYHNCKRKRKEVLEKLLPIAQEEAKDFLSYSAIAQEKQVPEADLLCHAYHGMVDGMERTMRHPFEGSLRDACRKRMVAEMQRLVMQEEAEDPLQQMCMKAHMDRESYLRNEIPASAGIEAE